MTEPNLEKGSSLLHGPVRPALLRYALPVILSMAATQLYTVADTMIIGLRLDAGALAAVSNASAILLLFLFVSGGIELGGGLLVAAAKPTATRQELTRLIYNLLVLDALVGLACTLLAWASLRKLLLSIHTPPEIVAQAVAYGRIYLLGLPALMLYDLCKQIVIGCGDSRTPMLAVAATSALNILLDLALVGPFGVAGAAAATAVSQLAGAGCLLVYLRRVLLDGPFRRAMLRADIARDIVRLSLPSAVQQAGGVGINAAKQGLLGWLGVTAIAGFSCASKLSTLMMTPIYGFTQSVVFFIAQNTAARQAGRVREGLREGRRLLLAYSALVAALCFFAGGGLLRLFTTDPEAIHYGRVMLAGEAATYLLLGQKHLLESRLRGAQRMGLYLTSNLGQILLNLGCCALLVPQIGFNGFWLSSCISAPVGLLLAWTLVRRGLRGTPEPACP